MIMNIENNKVVTGYPGLNQIDSSLICSFFISDKSFYFDDEADFLSLPVWIAYIKSLDLYHVTNLKETEDQTEADQYIISELDYEYFYKTGKYKFIFKSPFTLEYHQNLLNWSCKSMRVFLADINKHLYGKLSGGHIYGFNVEMFNVEKKSFSSGSAPAWTTIKIVLSDPTEYNENGIKSLVTWNPNRINLVFVEISDITGAGSVIHVKVTDTTYGYEINGLVPSDFIVIDDTGVLTVTSCVQTDCGEFDLTMSAPVTFGTIQIDTDHFYSIAYNYYIVQNTCVCQDYDWTDENNFEVDVLYAGDLSAVTGLLIADFTLVDDINGPVTLTSVTETTPGHYVFVSVTDLTSGDITIDDGTVTGTSEYQLLIECKFELFASTATNNFSCKITTLISDIEVTGLLLADFAVVDDNHESIPISSVSEGAGSVYTFTLGLARTVGDLILDDIMYFGTGNYDFEQAFISNGGASGTTDFVDTDLDGVADDFDLLMPGSITASIITDIYLTGNAQKLIDISTTGVTVGINCYLAYFVFGHSYLLRLKYRTVNAGTGPDRYTNLSIYSDDGTVYVNEDISPSTGYFSIYESTEFVPDDEKTISVHLAFNRHLMELIIDTIELIEV